MENYKNSDEYDERKDFEIEKIKEDNNKIIKTYFNELDLKWSQNDFLSIKNIDEIYADIIITLIEQKKFEDYEYTSKIMEDLEIENIELTKVMLDKIIDFFETNENIINEYLISEKKNLFNIKYINFYYLLLKYVFKNPIFVFQIKFLLKSRNIILELIKYNSKEFSLNFERLDNISKERLENILKLIINFNFYKENYLNLQYNDGISMNHINYNSTSINSNKKNNDNNRNKIYENQENPKSSYIDNEKEKNQNSSKIQDLNLLDSISTPLSQISKEQQSISYINNLNSLKSDINNSSIIKIKNKSNIAKNENIQQDFIYSPIFFSENSIDIIKEKQKNDNKDYSFLKFYKVIYNIGKKNSISKKQKILPNDTIDDIKEIGKIIICYGTMDKFLKFNEDYNNFEEKEVRDWINNIFGIKSDNTFDIIICTKKKIFLYHLDKENLIKKKDSKVKIEGNLLFLIEIKNNEFYCCSEYETKYLTNFFSAINDNTTILNNKNVFFKSGIKIYDFLLIFKSNKIATIGKDKLFFYNILSRKEIKNKINEEYSFVYSSNGIMVLPKYEENQYKTK